LFACRFPRQVGFRYLDVLRGWRLSDVAPILILLSRPGFVRRSAIFCYCGFPPSFIGVVPTSGFESVTPVQVTALSLSQSIGPLPSSFVAWVPRPVCSESVDPDPKCTNSPLRLSTEYSCRINDLDKQCILLYFVFVVNHKFLKRVNAK